MSAPNVAPKVRPRRRSNTQLHSVGLDIPAEDRGPYVAGAFKWAELLAQRIRGRFRYSPGLGWKQFNGAYWAKAVDEQLIPELRRTIEEHAPKLLRERGRDGATELGWASDSGIAKVLKVIKGTEGVFTRDEEFDPERPKDRPDLPHVFACANGITIELYDDGDWRARPSSPHDLITQVGCAYDPKAKAPYTEEMFALYQPDNAVRSFVFRIIAGSMRGIQIQHLFVWFGEKGGNGKGTMQAVFEAVFGTYAKVIPVAALMKSQASSGSREYRDELVQLKGKRLVFTSEPEEGARFSPGAVCELTGGTTMSGRGIGLRSIEFTPSFSLFLSANKRPRWADHGGMRRRYNETSWDYKIPEGEEDDSVQDRMVAEASGVLNIVLAHWADWCNKRVDAPEVVKAQTETGRREADPIQRFLVACTSLGPNLRARAGKLGLYDAYKEWCMDENERPVSGNRFATNVLALPGVERMPRTAIGIWYSGIGLIDDAA